MKYDVTSNASVYSWDLCTGSDGPGTRLSVFLAGCPLQCLYCQNPDTWRMAAGEMWSLDEMMKLVSRYKTIFDATGGGLTFSGGEPLLQARFVESVFVEAKKLGVHTALDTSGFLGAKASDALLETTDLVLLDVKSGLPELYKTVTSQTLEPTLVFGRRLAKMNIPIVVRFVLVPGLTDGVENITAVAEYVAGLSSLVRVDVLPFHQFGKDKWVSKKVPYTLGETPTPTVDEISKTEDIFRSFGLTV